MGKLPQKDAVYVRVSCTPQQSYMDSLEAQERKLQAIMVAKAQEFYIAYFDAAYAASMKNRHSEGSDD